MNTTRYFWSVDRVEAGQSERKSPFAAVVCAALASLVLVLVPANMSLADELNLGSRKPSSQEIIDFFKPASVKEPQNTVDTRGIRVLTEPPAAQQPVSESSTDAASGKPSAKSSPAAISMQVLFEFNSASLSNEAIEHLHPLGQALQSADLEGMRFIVEGHTDSTGSDEYNLVLSQRRALAVKQHLLQYYGVDASTLDVIGRGEYALLQPDQPTNPVNRRVRIVSTH